MTRIADRAENSTGTSAAQPVGRLIAVGVRDLDCDDLVAWVADEAVPGRDQVHLVHAFVPLHLDGCTWEPAVRTQDGRRLEARRIVNAVQQRLRSACPGLQLQSSAVAGLAEDVLAEFSQLVDLVVIGGDATGWARTRTITWHVQDVAQCPVLRVPQRWAVPRPDAPILFAAGDHELGMSALGFAADWAVRHSCALIVSRTLTSLNPSQPASPRWLAEQQEELDRQLAPLRDERPGLAVMARIELGDESLAPVARHARLVVAEAGDAARVRDIPATTVIVPRT